MMHELLQNGLLHDDVNTILGHGLSAFSAEPKLDSGKLVWRDAPTKSLDEDIVRPCVDAFAGEGGLVSRFPQDFPEGDHVALEQFALASRIQSGDQ